MDIRELRINSTVLFNDERVKITAIDYSEGEPFVLIDKEIWVSNWMHTTMLDPIPITEELLKELGFEKNGSNAYTKYLYESECFERVIRCCFLDDWRSTWTIKYWDDDNRDYLIGAEYLHELETFVYLTTKKELI